jgi:hypothetical protein
MLEMLSQARGISVDITSSRLEAALLEADEIKRLRPPYNVALTIHDRALWFTSPDLSARSPEPSPHCPVGPFASAETLDQFVALAQADHAALASGPWGPDDGTFTAGYNRLCAAHAELSRLDLSAHAKLLRLGTRLWREGRRDRDVDEDETNETRRALSCGLCAPSPTSSDALLKKSCEYASARCNDFPAFIAELTRAGVRCRNEMETGPGGRQVQIEDRSNCSSRLADSAPAGADRMARVLRRDVHRRDPLGRHGHRRRIWHRQHDDAVARPQVRHHNGRGTRHVAARGGDGGAAGVPAPTSIAASWCGSVCSARRAC